MIWEIYQQNKITSIKQTAERADRKAEKADRKVGNYSSDNDETKRHLNRLSLACQAMWELLKENSDLNELDLENKILEVDLRDGKADRKITTRVLSCPSCGKNTNSKRNNCIMCGAPLSKSNQFEV